MPSPYSSTEISQTGDPTMGQAGVQNPNVNDNLFAASYPGAPGRAADSSIPGGGSDLASQGLAKLQQGDQYGGIMTLLDAAQQNPQSVQSQAFLQQLQIVESQPAAPTNNGGDASQFSPPSDSSAYGTMSDTTAMQTPTNGAGATDANAIANQALSVAQSNPAEGILGLMQASTQNPDLLNDQNFLTTMSEVLPQGPGAQTQQPMDASQLQQPTQQSMDASQLQQPTQQSMDASQMLQPQTQQPMDASQMLQPQTQQPMDASQLQQPQTQQPMDASQLQQPQTQQPMDASQLQQPQTQQPVDTSQLQQPQTQQPMDASQYSQMPTDASNIQSQPVADSTQQQGGTYTLPAQLTSSGDPNIEAGVKQAFQLIQSGDQFDGARILMMIAKADPSILQDQAFIKNLVDLESAVKAGGTNAATDQSALSQTGQAQYDANGNPIDANGNPINQQVDASGNPIPQPGAQQMVDASGNPIPQPGAQQMVDASGNPIPQPGAQQMVDASGNPIPQPGAQQMVDASGNPIPTDSQTMPYTQGMTGMSVP